MTSRTILAACVATMSVSIPHCVAGQDLDTYELVLKAHAFSPAEIHVHAGKPFIVVVKNANGQADEFEMLIPFVERGVPDGAVAHVVIRPLRPGRFPFFGEGDPDNERGAFISE